MSRPDLLRYGWEIDPDSPPHRKSKMPTGVRKQKSEQKIISQIMSLHSQGLGGNAIKRALEAAKIPFRGRETWSAATIRKIIRREKGSQLKDGAVQDHSRGE